MSEVEPAWYALYTRSRHEKLVAEYLRRQELEVFLPLRRCISRRVDRKVVLQLPALPGYLFVRTCLYAETRAMIKRSTGVIRLVETGGQPARIPARQIDSLRTALAHAFDPHAHPYLQVGDRVRVARGPMAGAEGYLLRLAQNRHRLVIGIDYVNQALSVEIDADDVEPVDESVRARVWSTLPGSG